MHIRTIMRDNLLEMLELKQLPRTGWVRCGVEHPESVAAHSWGMAVLALRLAPKELDIEKILSLCLIHDLPEVRVGDLTPYDDSSNKAELEHKAMSEIAPQWLSLFEEYETGETAEAKFVKQIDKLDMGLQAILYQTKQNIVLDEFVASAKSNITDENLLRFLD